jgi:Spy/CpxP family protein refolding chaperone
MTPVRNTKPGKEIDMRKMGASVRKSPGIAAVLVLLPALALAFGGPGRGGRGYGPPQEAIDVCAGKSAGDRVSLTTPCGDNVAGTCRETAGGLAAVPDGRHRGKDRMGRRHAGRFPGKEAAWTFRKGTVPGRSFERMAKALGLTEEQREKVRAILASEREKTEPLRRQIAEDRSKIREAMEAVPFDEKAVRALAADRERIRTELLVSKGRAHNEIHALLTPEQKERVKEFRSRGNGRHRPCPWK